MIQTIPKIFQILPVVVTTTKQYLGIRASNLYIKRCLSQSVGLYHKQSAFLNFCSCVSYLTLSLLQTQQSSLKILMVTFDDTQM